MKNFFSKLKIKQFTPSLNAFKRYTTQNMKMNKKILAGGFFVGSLFTITIGKYWLNNNNYLQEENEEPRIYRVKLKPFFIIIKK